MCSLGWCNRSNALVDKAGRDGGKWMDCPLVYIRMVVGVSLDVHAFKIFLDENWQFVLFVMVEHHICYALVLKKEENFLSVTLAFMPIFNREQ